RKKGGNRLSFAISRHGWQALESGGLAEGLNRDPLRHGLQRPLCRSPRAAPPLDRLRQPPRKQVRRTALAPFDRGFEGGLPAVSPAPSVKRRTDRSTTVSSARGSTSTSGSKRRSSPRGFPG